jgi:uncharacterized RDD family membrane protein YckC
MTESIEIKFRRIVSLLMDVFIVVFIGAIIGFSFQSQLWKAHGYESYIGMVVILIYHGILNSKVCGGQTIGKKIFGLKVVNIEGRLISLSHSLLRTFIISLFVLGIPDLPSHGIFNVIGYVSAFVLIGTLSIYFFTPWLRTPHDYFSRTAVVKRYADGYVHYPFYTWYLAPATLFSFLLIVYWIIVPHFIHYNSSYVKGMMDTQEELLHLSNVIESGVEYEDKTYTLTLRITTPPSKDHELFLVAFDIFDKHFGRQDSLQKINIGITRGYDIKIFQWWDKYFQSHTYKEWIEKRNQALPLFKKE